MSDALNIRDIQTLYDLRSSLGHFVIGAQECLHSIETEISHKQEWLEEREQYWYREVNQAKRELDQVLSDLRRCQMSAYRDDDGNYHQPDCSNQAQAVRQAEKDLRECIENLDKVRTWQSKVAQAVSEYQKMARRLSEVTNSHMEKAQASLTETAAKYEAAKEAALSVGDIGGVSAGMIGLTAFSEPLPSSDALQGLDGKEIQEIIRKWIFEGFSTYDLERLKILRAETLQDDIESIYPLLESKAFYEATRGLSIGVPEGGESIPLIITWAESLAGGISDMSKVVQYWKNKG